MNEIKPTCAWPVRALLGEGPLWHASQRCVYFVDIKGGQLHRFDPESGRTASWPVDGQPSFIVAHVAGGFVCGVSQSLYSFHPEAARAFEQVLRVEDAQSGNRLNDGFVDPLGRLWFGSMCDAEEKPTGSLYLLGESGRPRKEDDGYVVSNGPAMSVDGKSLFHTNTLDRVIWKFDVADNGGLSNKRVFLHTREPGWPDGMAVDAEGCLWVAFFGGWRIDRYTAQGDLAGSVRFPCANVTKPVFGGADLRTVYATTATKGLAPHMLASQPLAGGLFTFRSPVAGLPQAICTVSLPLYP